VPGPDPATAAIRRAVRDVLAPLTPGSSVLVACSGGADSLALASAVAFEAPKLALRAGAVVVDHGLQAGSADVAAAVAAALAALGLQPVEVATVVVTEAGEGLEAAAREARYAALEAAAARRSAALVLLGHTLDDQAEQVLLGLARGSGARSLSGMPPTRGRLVRPLLGVTRSQTRESVRAQGLSWWEDPMNADPVHLRVRARRALADLEADLGPGVVAALARTAAQLRDDADLLESLAEEAVPSVLSSAPDATAGWVAVRPLLSLPRALRTRIWRRLLVEAGAPAGQLSARHTEACDALVTAWHGQGPVHVPGGLRVSRTGSHVTIGPAPAVEWDPSGTERAATPSRPVVTTGTAESQE